MNTPDLPTCQALKAAGYPQELKIGDWFYAYHYPPHPTKKDERWFSDPILFVKGEVVKVGEEMKIPTTDSLLKWFSSFAERWAERAKIESAIINISLSKNIDSTRGRWCFQVAIRNKSRITERIFYHAIPDPLAACLELFMQMWKEMGDE